MKRLLPLLLLFAGLAFAQSAHAQSDKDKDKKKKEQKDTTKTNTNRSAPAPGGGSGGTITIDEGGSSRPTKGRPQNGTATNGNSQGTSTEAKPKQEAQNSQKSTNPSEGAPAPIAIDEGGSQKVKHGNKRTSSDSATVAPAEGVARPQ